MIHPRMIRLRIFRLRINRACAMRRIQRRRRCGIRSCIRSGNVRADGVRVLCRGRGRRQDGGDGCAKQQWRLHRTFSPAIGHPRGLCQGYPPMRRLFPFGASGARRQSNDGRIRASFSVSS
jgi:hypothetical protein